MNEVRSRELRARHAQLVCMDCRARVAVCAPDLARPVRGIRLRNDFQVVDYRFLIFGTCQECARTGIEAWMVH